MRYKEFIPIITRARNPIMISAAFFGGYLYGKNTVQIKPKNDYRIVPNKKVSEQKLTSQCVVLIDWDNCLCNTMPRVIKRLTLVRDELACRHSDLKVSDEKLRAPWTSEFSTHLQALFGDDYWQEAHSLYFEYIDHKEVPPKQPFPGAEAFLLSLKDADIPFAIVSNSTSKLVKHGVEVFGWEKLLADVPIVSSDKIKPRNKPDPYHFLQAIERLNLKVTSEDFNKVVVIGDGVDSDMLGALNLAKELSPQGITVSAIWTTHDKSVQCELRSFSDFDDLQELVESNGYRHT